MYTMQQILFNAFTCLIFLFYNNPHKSGFLGSFAGERELQCEPGFPGVSATPPGRLLYVAPAHPLVYFKKRQCRKSSLHHLNRKYIFSKYKLRDRELEE
jgi:hypothetical protein